MELAFLDPKQVPASLAALQSVAHGNGRLTDPERTLLALVAEMHGTRLDLDALPEPDPVALAAQVVDAHQRKRLVQMAVVMAMVDGEVTAGQERTVRSIAEALEVDEASLKVLHGVVNDSKLLTRVHVMRRLMGPFVGDVRKQEGLAGIRKFLGPIFFGTGDDPEVTWRYKQLGLLPQGTFGRAYWEFCTSRRFAFPGEPGGIPERMVFHDFGHVLSGYETDAEGEIQQGAFQAGFTRTDGFSFLLFVICQFHLGIKVTPVAAPRTGLLDVRKVLRAAERGAACRDDLSARWDHWAWVELPVDEVRHRLGVPPLAA
ncbi:MAG TPA: hypothetical protein VMH40_18360 [Myxococcaceae bacterium]|nr:hypothetical protein [Myxococcaceae bacterium]